MHQVHLFYTSIEEWKIEDLESWLSLEEWNQCKAIQHWQTRCQKIVNRVMLKQLLIHRYGIQPSKLHISYTSKGKPFLSDDPDLYFNASHAHNLVLIGISKGIPIGVDIEYMQLIREEEAVAHSFFSPLEYASYLCYRQTHSEAFYQFWTAKEAILKALGMGIWEANQAPQVLYLNDQFCLFDHSKHLIEWSLYHCMLQANYQACLAMPSHRQEVMIEAISPHHFPNQ